MGHGLPSARVMGAATVLESVGKVEDVPRAAHRNAGHQPERMGTTTTTLRVCDKTARLGFARERGGFTEAPRFKRLPADC